MSGVRVILPDGESITLPAVQSVAAEVAGRPWADLTDDQRLRAMGRVMEVYGALSRTWGGATVPNLDSGWRRFLLRLAGVRN